MLPALSNTNAGTLGRLATPRGLALKKERMLGRVTASSADDYPHKLVRDQPAVCKGRVTGRRDGHDARQRGRCGKLRHTETPCKHGDSCGKPVLAWPGMYRGGMDNRSRSSVRPLFALRHFGAFVLACCLE